MQIGGRQGKSRGWSLLLLAGSPGAARDLVKPVRAGEELGAKEGYGYWARLPHPQEEGAPGGDG